MRIALLASRRLRHGPLSPLLRFARDFMPFLEQHEIITTDGCCRAFLRSGLFWSHPKFQSVGSGFEGALVRITSGVVPGPGDVPEVPIDVVIYLVDPRDPSSNYPETNALKRECVVHKKPFLATSRSARLWAILSWKDENIGAIGSYAIDPSILPYGSFLSLPLNRQTAALIAHDKKKMEMLEFARDNFSFLLAFGRRVGTGTTGELLNGRRPKRIEPDQWEKYKAICETLREKIKKAKAAKLMDKDKDFVEPLRSGPDGGDVQIARKVLDGECHSIIFFEDPDVARQHEQDIQLLERTGRTRGKSVICVHDPKTATDLARKWTPMPDSASTELLLVTTALERRFNVKPILVEGGEASWPQILEASTWFLMAQVAALAADRKKQGGEDVRVTISWGVGLSELARTLASHYSRLVRRDKTELRRRKASQSLSRFLGLADDRYFRPGNVIVGPMQGVMAAADDAVEANAIASVVADFFGGVPVELALAALMQNSPTKGTISRREVPKKIMKHWDRTDILITTCAQIRKEYAGKVPAPDFDLHFQEVKRASCGDFGGIYLKSDGGIFEPDRFVRVGMSEDQIRRMRERGGQAVLIAGAQQAREEIAFTVLETGLISVLISDLAFAKRLLNRAPIQKLKPRW